MGVCDFQKAGDVLAELAHADFNSGHSATPNVRDNVHIEATLSKTILGLVKASARLQFPFTALWVRADRPARGIECLRLFTTGLQATGVPFEPSSRNGAGLGATKEIRTAPNIR